MSEPPKDGLHVEYYDNGQKKSEANYKNGKLDGLETSWYENGQEESRVYWKNGDLNGRYAAWYESGQKMYEKHYKNDKAKGRELDGSWTEWFENGQEREFRFKDGVIKSHTEWYENGQKKSKEHSRNDLTVEETRWDENGEIVFQMSYSHGIRASYIPNQFLIWPFYNSPLVSVLWIPVFYSSWFGSGELAEKVFSGRDCGMLMSLASLFFMALLVYTAAVLVVDKLHSGDSFYDWLKGYSNDLPVTDALSIVCYVFPGSLIALVLFFVFGFNSTPAVLLANSVGWFFVLCFLPTFVAIKKDHPQFVPLAIVNFFFGATVIGWAGCLAWAFWNFDKPDSG